MTISKLTAILQDIKSSVVPLHSIIPDQQIPKLLEKDFEEHYKKYGTVFLKYLEQSLKLTIYNQAAYKASISCKALQGAQEVATAKNGMGGCEELSKFAYTKLINENITNCTVVGVADVQNLNNTVARTKNSHTFILVGIGFRELAVIGAQENDKVFNVFQKLKNCFLFDSLLNLVCPTTDLNDEHEFTQYLKARNTQYIVTYIGGATSEQIKTMLQEADKIDALVQKEKPINPEKDKPLSLFSFEKLLPTIQSLFPKIDASRWRKDQNKRAFWIQTENADEATAIKEKLDADKIEKNAGTAGGKTIISISIATLIKLATKSDDEKKHGD